MKRYVLVGAGQRSVSMFARPIAERFGDVAQICGVFDVNAKRAAYVGGLIGPAARVYTDFDKMVDEMKPDAVIVTTVDTYHHVYVVRALELGCDVICEKPLTITEDRCRSILQAEKRYGKTVHVTFNCRFMPMAVRVKELLNEGCVGKILSVNYEHLLDRRHGADYFRRWHRIKENSGGLLIHKATHHFDLLNWWIDQRPDEIYANGALQFYGPTRQNRGERCSTCKYTESCEFSVHYQDDPFYRDLYFKTESEDGYFRDRCVFSEEIDIEDSMSVTVRYDGGALLTYSLNAHSPYESWRVAVNGTRGRLEATEYYSGRNASDPLYHITVFDDRGDSVTYDFHKTEGVHSGGDERLQAALFRGGVSDPLGQLAGAYEGVMSVMIGVCANRSMREHRMFRVGELLQWPDGRS